MSRLALILRKEFLHIKRDKLSLRLLIMMPIMQLMILGFALNKDVKNLKFALVDQDHSQISQNFAAHQDIIPNYIQRQNPPIQNAQTDLLDQMQHRLLSAGIIVPPHFGHDFQLNIDRVLAGETSTPPQLQVLLNGEDANGAAIASGYISGMANAWANQQIGVELRKIGMDPRQLEPVQVQNSLRFNPELISAWFMIPGIAAILVTMVCSLLVAFSVVREKENGTLEQLLVTPLANIEILVGKTIPYLIIGFVELFVVLGLGAVVFGVPIRAEWTTLVLFNFLYMIPILGLAILISALVKTQQQALFLVWFCLIFFLLTGGFLLPWENMPQWLKILTEANPLRFFITVLRESLLKGSGPVQLWSEALHLLILGLIFYGSAILVFKRNVG